jgi:hypothetical protein
MFHLHSQNKMFHVLRQVAAVLQCKFHCGICSELQNVGVKTAFRIAWPQSSYIFETSSSGHAFNMKLKSDCNLIFLEISLLLVFLKVFSLL